jgi:hypothetical protein
MHQVFEITRLSRKIVAEYLEHYTLEQLNKIPEGFHNNLIWNIGHIIVVQQMLVYNLSGLPMKVSQEMVEKYKKGSKPEGNVSLTEMDEIRSLLFETINQTKVDFNSKIFKTYTEFTTLSGFTIRNVEDALAFNYYHEAIHIGMMMSIRKFI